MKFNKDGKVYVHKQDVMYLFDAEMGIPLCLLDKMGMLTGVTIVDNSNRFELLEFKEEKDIKTVNEVETFVDFNEIKHLSVDDLKRLIEKRQEELKKTREMYFSLTDATEKSVMSKKFNRLALQLFSLRDFLLYKCGEINMEIPKGIEIERDTPKGKGSILDGLKMIFKKKNKKDNN